jgi:hypothetical protein
MHGLIIPSLPMVYNSVWAEAEVCHAGVQLVCRWMGSFAGKLSGGAVLDH